MNLRDTSIFRVFVAVLIVAFSGVLLAAGCGVDEAREAGERAASEAGNDTGSEEEARSGEGSRSNSGESEGTSQAVAGGETTVSETSVPEETTGSLAEATEGTLGGTSQSERSLPDKWYIDSDGNKALDFIEAKVGYDPEVDDCLLSEDCPGVSQAELSTLLEQEQNTLLMLDSSGSMSGDAGGGQTKMKSAKDALEKYVTGTPDFVNLGFMVYGHKGSNAKADKVESCEGVEVLKQPGEVDYRSFPATLGSFEPVGWTPIASSLKKAGEAFAGREGYSNRVILVTDGVETCGGDPVAAARSLKRSGVSVTVDVVGFDIVNTGEEEQLSKIAEATGGEYTTAKTGADLDAYFDSLLESLLSLRAAQNCAGSQASEITTCYGLLANDVYREMNELAQDYEYGSEEEREIRQLQNTVQVEVRASGEKKSERLRERYKKLGRLAAEAQRRYNRRYNEGVSYAPSCPESTVYASLGGDDTPGSVTAALLAPNP